ncbi:hypothetical protein AWX17_20325 [Priestia megaterium]|nr:hypothetical protein AWX17_20325 [Priestia megaterium]
MAYFTSAYCNNWTVGIRSTWLFTVLSLNGNGKHSLIYPSFITTIVFLLRLFSILEKMQDELKADKVKQATMIERGKLARELHDGTVQMSLLLSIKLNKFEKRNHIEQDGDFQKIECRSS